MNVTVKLFAVAKQSVGRDTIEVELAEPATVAELRMAIAEQFPSLAPIVRHAHIAVDAEYAIDAAPLTASAEVALIPPVSGG